MPKYLKYLLSIGLSTFILGFSACHNVTDKAASDLSTIPKAHLNLDCPKEILPLITEIIDSFSVLHPEIQISINNISDKETDLAISFASSDKQFPSTVFAIDEMVIAYTNQSKCFKLINSNNWVDILLKPNVTLGRVLPDSQLIGAHTLMTLLLSENYYHREGITKLLENNNNYFNRSSIDQITQLLQSHLIDYAFMYSSTARRKHLFYIKLPDEINLSKSVLNDKYNAIDFNSIPSLRTFLPGHKAFALQYTVSILKHSKNQDKCKVFVDYLQQKAAGIIQQKATAKSPNIVVDDE